MKIRHERPMSDLSFEVRAPLGLELTSGETVSLTNWSLQGFEYPEPCDVLPKEATLSIPFQGVDIRFPIRLERTGDGSFLTFEGLTGRQRETLAIFYRSILSGKMASTDEIITSLDTPVDLVPMEETEEEKAVATEGKTPRSIRATLSVLLYLVLGALITWTLGSGIYTRIATVDILNARVEAPLISHRAQQGGFISEVLIAEGDVVAAGELLVRITNPEGEVALSEVRTQIRLVEEHMDDARERYELLEQRLALVRATLLDDIRSSTPETAALAEARLAAFEQRQLDEYVDLFAAYETVGREVSTLKEELRRLRRERGRLRDAADSLHIVAAEAGTITLVAVRKSQLVSPGSEVLVIEGQDVRLARGWADQSMTAIFHPGMFVDINLGTAQGGRSVLGRIVDVQAGIAPELSPEFGLLVTVAFEDMTVAETRQVFPHLMPVELSAIRPWAWSLREKTAWLFGLGEE